MKKIIKIFFISLFIVFLRFSLFPPQTLAAQNCGGTPDSGIRENNIITITNIGEGQLNPSSTYVIRFYGKFDLELPVTITNGSASFTIDKAAGTINGATRSFIGYKPNVIDVLAKTGRLNFFFLRTKGLQYESICEDNYTEISQATCENISTDKDHYQPNDTIVVSGKLGNIKQVTLLHVLLTEPNTNKQTACPETTADGSFSSSFKVNEGQPGGWTISVYLGTNKDFGGCNPIGTQVCSKTFTATAGPGPTGSPTNTTINACGGAEGNPADITTPLGKCYDCIGKGATDPKSGQYSWTALGCIPTDPNAFVNDLLPKVIGMAGGIAFLLMLWGAFTVLTSSGNPDKLNNGKEVIVSAIAGLLVIIFSVFLLKVIGFDILQIPGFG